jgi:hypothetical protein
VRISQILPADQDDVQNGKRAGDAVGYYVLHIPPDDAVQSATIDYAKVFSASRQQLRDWFENKVVVIGDARDGKDGPYATPDGRRYSGYLVHAIGIDSILSQDSILAPPYTGVMGAYFSSSFLFDTSGVAAGALLGLALPQVVWRRRAFSLLLAFMILVLSVLIYRQGRIMYDPIVAMLGVMVSAEAVGRVRSLSWRNHANA